MISFKYDKTITPDLIKEMERRYPNQDLMIVIENTKYQSPEKLETIARLFPNKKIIISVTGGLNPKKTKYNCHHYQSRTYHSPLELSKIIKVFEKIERKIVIDWSELEKAMYIYAYLCQTMTYAENIVNGVDTARSLSGLIYGKAVCAGFALILKEAYDRVGIECIYQNQRDTHSWNIARINGLFRGLDLTWDCCQKKKNMCRFLYFGLVKDFYRDPDGYHSIARENEEHEYPIATFKRDELNKSADRINASGYKIFPLNKNGVITIDGKGLLARINQGKLEVLNWQVRKFVRKDGSVFYLIPVGTYKGLYKFFYFGIENNLFKGANIYSDTPLDQIPPEYEYDVANGLLSKERLSRKLKQFNGYVGYIGKNHGIYYNKDFEQNELNIIR